MRPENPSGNRVKQQLIDLDKLPIEARLRRYPEPAQRTIRRISETESCTLEEARKRYHRRGTGGY